ncbi:hypothetical protein ACJJTC_017302 [Scirpophaga incertulas]
MATWQFLVVLLSAAVAQAAAKSRVVGGQPTTIEEYPSIVQVEFYIAGVFWTQSCAGVVLNNFYIVSAAHCFDRRNYNPADRRIRAGTTLRNEGGVVVPVREFNHPTFGLNGNDGDITVVRLGSILNLGGAIQQGSLMASGFVLPGGWPVTVVG